MGPMLNKQQEIQDAENSQEADSQSTQDLNVLDEASDNLQRLYDGLSYEFSEADRVSKSSPERTVSCSLSKLSQTVNRGSPVRCDPDYRMDWDIDGLAGDIKHSASQAKVFKALYRKGEKFLLDNHHCILEVQSVCGKDNKETILQCTLENDHNSILPDGIPKTSIKFTLNHAVNGSHLFDLSDKKYKIKIYRPIFQTDQYTITAYNIVFIAEKARE